MWVTRFSWRSVEAVSSEALSLSDPHTVPTAYWHRLDDGRIQCDVCPRACKLHEGQRGLCFVRERVDDQMVLTTLRPLVRVLRRPDREEAAQPLPSRLGGAVVRHRRLQPRLQVLPELGHLEVARDRHADRIGVAGRPLAEARVRLGCRSVAFTYNDPVIFAEYAMDVADACRERGIKTVAVTAGYINAAPRAEFYAHMDAANVDLKAFTEDVLRARSTFAHLAPVLETLEYLRHETDVWFEITTLLIPGHNDSDAEIAAECAWIAEHLGPDVPLHFTAFHPDFKMRDVPPTPPATLRRARRIALDHGLRYVYTGNVHDPDGQTTTCPTCDKPLIVRDWYEILTYRLTGDGRCSSCAGTLPGRFDGPAGTWGSRRLPVRLA